MEDFWDLEAVVRGNCAAGLGGGGGGVFFSEKSPARDFPSPYFESPAYAFDELEQVYRPFYPPMPPQPPPNSLSPPQHLISANTTASPSSSAGDSARTIPPGGAVSALQPPTPKRKRKNQQKKVVHKVVTAEGPTSDKWAWRKYGQKPIKGSPYPRSYYRCSSSKGCLARKQVERSCSDPSMFIITYSADHDHAYPTRRSSLAGSTRSHKTFCSSSYAAKALTSDGSPDMQTPGLFKLDDTSCSPNSNASALSPATPPAAASMEDEYADREEGEEGSDDNEMEAEVGEWDLGLEISLEKWNGGNSSLPMDDGFLSFDEFSETFAY